MCGLLHTAHCVLPAASVVTRVVATFFGQLMGTFKGRTGPERFQLEGQAVVAQGAELRGHWHHEARDLQMLANSALLLLPSGAWCFSAAALLPGRIALDLWDTLCTGAVVSFCGMLVILTDAQRASCNAEKHQC